MKHLLPLLLILLCCCSDDEVSIDGVGLRIVNQSTINFDRIIVSSGGPQQDFGSLKSGQTSEYREFESIYRYGYVRVEANDKEYILQPIDYVGEKKFEKGRFSFLINIHDPENQRSVSLEFRED